MKKVISIIAVFLVMLALPGCSNQEKVQTDDTKKLVYGAEFEYEKINPILEETTVDEMIFSGLTKFDENNKVVPDLAKKWDISLDGLEYTFTLRDDVKWHDGEKFMAGDVKFTIDKVIDPNTNTAKQEEFEQVNSVEVIDEHKVKVILKKPFPPLLEKLSIGVVPKHLLEGKDINNADFNSNPIGTGPFRFKVWNQGSDLTVVANEDFYNGRAKLDTVIFKFLPDANVRLVQLETGEIDLAYLEPDQLERIKTMENIKLYEMPTADYRCMMYNMKEPLWQDVKVRKALNYAVDRQAIIDGIVLGKGTRAYGPLQVSWANNPDVEKYEYNLDKAQTLLKEAGWKPGSDGILEKDGKKFSFKLTCPITDPVRVALANSLATDFKKIGVEAIPDPLDWSVIKIDETESFLLGWGSPFDPDDHTYRLFTSGVIGKGLNNLGSYKNSEIDRLLELARTTSDTEKRKEYYGEFQKVLAEDPPYNFICYLDALYGVNKNVEGIKPRTLGHHGAGFLWNIEEWDIQGE
ncbi:peptide/nickel transport system substrate-binding protein [Desulfonispora thiosulfatigenes DSM 11270]|uniref:Peptide/nickel transport system substrate-binding protein n=1 Tax=Desulfonispora thiosulfatigenes DSM 11270 TaxID=656914 RepID=A0A1W1V9C3_DESTI|nr:ABC transporter substrate-binding protein [Desulfonispora thiosulfatigenes]SMB89661.1 peptide/nickel transport system substrate-binding protein [Desulfonispora thiosulfatigenes DSM 11270]